MLNDIKKDIAFIIENKKTQIITYAELADRQDTFD